MSGYRHRRPRYYDDDSDGSVDDYPPPKPRASDRRPPPPRERDDRPPPPRDLRDDIPPPPMGVPPTQRRPSILVDPDETSSQRERRRPRSRSNVRLQTSDDENDFDPRRRGPPPRPRDLESKDTDEHRKFRAKRDGYESDEAVEHKRTAPKAQRPPPPRDYGDEPERPRHRHRDPRDDLSLPLRGKTRDALEDAALAGGVGATAAAAEPRISRRRTYKEPRPKDRYDDYESPRRDDQVRAPRRRPTEYDDPGYRSDGARPRRTRPPPQRAYDDYDDYDRPRRRDDAGGYRHDGDRRPAPQDYYSDYREDRAPRRGDPRRDSMYRDDDRRRDDRPKSSRGRGGGLAGMVPKGWEKEAGAAFMTYALPYIKKEGPKYLQKFLKAQGGAR